MGFNEDDFNEAVEDDLDDPDEEILDDPIDEEDEDYQDPNDPNAHCSGKPIFFPVPFFTNFCIL